MKKKVSKFLYWAPRVMSIVFTAFLALFSLDVFGMGLGFWQTMLAFLMHNIPVIILAGIVWISWKYEIVGAIAFALAGLIYIILLITSQNFEWFMLSWSVTISGPAFVVSALYFLNWNKKRK